MKKSVLIFGLCIILLSSFVLGVEIPPDSNNTVAYWALEDLTDSVGSNDLVNTGTATSGVTGIIDDAYSFDGSFDYMETPVFGGFNYSNSFTVGMWIYPTTLGVIQTLMGESATYGFYFRLEEDNALHYLYVGSSGAFNTDADGTNTVTLNTWNFVAVTYDSATTTAKLYVNTDVDTFSSQEDYKGSPNSFALGTQAIGLSQYFNGKIDEVSIFDTALSSNEMSYLYNNGSPTDFQQYPFIPFDNFSITAKDFFSKETIYNFSANINGTIYYSNISSGTIITSINRSLGLNFSINISSKNYFNRLYYHNVSGILYSKLYQSIINVSGINTLLNPVSNWSLYNGSTILLNTSSDSGIAYLSAGNYNDLSIISNDNGFVSQEVSGFSVNALDNKSVNITIYDFSLNITAKNLITSNFIDNFSISIKDLADSSTRNFNTTTGNVLIGIMNSSYNITISSEGYSFYNSSAILELNSSYNYTFNLYTRNSVNISIFDEDTGVLVNELMDVSFVSSSLSYNFSTTTGTLYEDLLSPNSYAITYKGDNYSLRTYYFELVNNSYNRLILYTSKVSSQNVTAIVYDKSSVTLEGARIKVKKYSNIYNSFIVNQIAQTNFEGTAGLQLKLLDTFYIFEIYYPYNVLRFESDKTYIYDTTLRFYIDTDSFLVARDYYDVANIYGSLTYESDRFKMVYDNPLGTSYEFCLSVYQSKVMGDSLINSSCATSSGGTIYQGFTPVNGSTYYGKATVDFDGENVVLDVLSKSFKESLVNKTYWLFGVLLMCIVFAFLDYQMSSKMVILTPVPLVFASYLGIINISLYISMGIWVAGFVLSLILKGR